MNILQQLFQAKGDADQAQRSRDMLIKTARKLGNKDPHIELLGGDGKPARLQVRCNIDGFQFALILEGYEERRS